MASPSLAMRQPGGAAIPFDPMIPPPFLLYLGRSADALGIKTSRGLAAFRPEDCAGEFRHDDCPQTLGLPRLSMEEAAAKGARTLVLGIAGPGGKLPADLIEDAATALQAGMNVAAGLHERLRDQPQLAELARERGLQLFDVRDAPLNLNVGKGNPRAGRRLLTVGTDCSVGKMYATLALTRGLRERGVSADFRATGQTGILIAGAGVPVDAVIADFISGAIEQLAPAREDEGWDLIEGQGSLFHPSFAGVSLGLLHGAQPEALVLCHEPGRPHMRGVPGRALPDLADCLERNIEAARLTSPKVRAVGVCLNTSAMEREAALRLCARIEDQLGLPCTDPIAFGVETIVDRMLCPAPLALSTTVST